MLLWLLMLLLWIMLWFSYTNRFSISNKLTHRFSVYLSLWFSLTGWFQYMYNLWYIIINYIDSTQTQNVFAFCFAINFDFSFIRRRNKLENCIDFETKSRSTFVFDNRSEMFSKMLFLSQNSLKIYFFYNNNEIVWSNAKKRIEKLNFSW